ncbi:MAG TPA: transporter [Acidobacteriaceae bacterium]|jgi:hypothetical protein
MFLRPFVLTIALLLAAPLFAQTQSASSAPAPEDPRAQAAQHATQVRTAQPDIVDLKIQQALRERDAIIRNLLQRVQELETRLNESNAASGRVVAETTATAAPAAAAAPVAAAPPAASTLASTVNNATYDDTERHASAALDRALLVRGSLLLPSGMLEVDNMASYYSMSSDHVTVNGFALFPVLVVGDITSERLRRDILIHSVTSRLGLTKKLQMDFMVPYGYILDRTVDATNNETSESQFGLGDIVAGLSYQFVTEHGNAPDLLASFHYKSNTGTNSYDLQSADTSLGTGFNGLTGTLTAAKTNDPLVFFGSLNYTKNLPAHHTIPVSNPSDPSETSMVGFLRPGDAYGFQLGSVLALNPETSMTLGWDQRFTRQTKLNGQALPASYLVEGSLRIGTSYMYAPGRMLDLSFGVGLTPDTPNLQFSVDFPFRRTLWKPSF